MVGGGPRRTVGPGVKWIRAHLSGVD